MPEGKERGDTGTIDIRTCYRTAQHSTAQHGTGQDSTGAWLLSECTPFRAPMRAWSKNCVMLQKEGRKEERGKKQYMKKEEGRKEW